MPTTTTQKNMPKWQQIIQERNLDISVVEVGDLYQKVRLDPEFYSKEFLDFETKNSQSFRELGIKVFSGPFGSFLKSDTYQETGHPFVRISDIKDVFLDKNSMVSLDDENFIKMKSFHLFENDIVLSKVGTVGKLSLITSEIGTVAISENNIGIKFLEHSLPFKLFTFTFLISKYGQKEFLRFQSGNVQPKLNVADGENFKIPIPSKPFQEKIAQMVQKAHSEREKSKNLYKEAENILLEELDLADWEPTEKNIAVKDSEEVRLFGRADAEFFQPKYDEILEKIKNYKGGNDELLNRLISIETGEYSEKYYQKDNEKDFYIRSTNINEYGEIDIDENYYVDADKFKKIAKKGQIITPRVGALGIFAHIDEYLDGSVYSDNVICFELPKEFLPEVYTFYLNCSFNKMLIDRFSRGSVQQRLNQETLKFLKIPILESNIQQKIAEKIKASHVARENSKKLLEQAKQAVEIFVEEDEGVAEKFLNTLN